MAGIGFELKKVFNRNSLAKTTWGYTCATVVVSGPTFLIIGLLLGLERIAASNPDPQGSWSVLQVMVIYAMLGALITSSILNQVLSRYSADALFRKEYGRIMPSLYGAYLLLVIPCGIGYAYILSTAEGVSLFDRALNWFDWAMLTFVYVQLAYLTAIKKYRNLVLWFALGILVGLLTAILFLNFLDIPLLTSVHAALFCGFGVMLCGYSRELHVEFPVGYGSLFSFIEYMIKYPALIICSFFAIMMSFSHIIIMWTGVYGEHVMGLFYRAPLYDTAAFYAFLVYIPTNVLFVVSMEVRFYQRYQAYFSVVSSNGTLSDVRKTGANMLASLKHELLRIELIQLVFLFAYMALMRFYLSTIGFTQTILIIFFLLCIGYAAYGIGVSLMLLLLYFDYRRGAMLTALAGCLVTTAVTLLTRMQTHLYGLGMACGGISMFLVGLLLLSRYVRNIDERVFCRQPIFDIEKNGLLLKFIRRLDRRALEKREKFDEKRRDRRQYIKEEKVK